MFTLTVRKLFRKSILSWQKATPPRPKARPTFRPRLEVLEDRWLPSGIVPDSGGGGGGGGGGGNSDTLIWSPQGGSQNAAMATNWFDQNTGLRSTVAPGASNPIVLDGNFSPGGNSPIEITQDITVASITVQGNYKNTMTFDPTFTLVTDGNATIQSGSMLTFSITSNNVGLGLNDGANLTVSSGATLNIPQLTVVKGGGVTFLYSDDNNAAGEYLNNAGTVNWQGPASTTKAGIIVDYINVPVLNTGTFNANGGSGGNINLFGAYLAIADSDAKTNNVSFDQTGGTLSLTNNAVVVAQKGYYQPVGTIQSDATPCMLSSGNGGSGDINITGGKVIVDTVAGSVSTLTFDCATFEFNGELDVNGLTTGGKSQRCDQLICTGDVTLGADSVLNVDTTGTAPLGTGNQWTVMTYASISGFWGTTSVPEGMSVSTGETRVLVSN